MNNTTTPTRSEIFTAYNIARAAARKAGNTKLIERLNKALGILLSKSYYDGEKALYIPTLSDCGCKDWQFRHAARRGYTGPCKHMLAEALIYDIFARREACILPAAYLVVYA
jgi:hypothetical protein